MKSPTFTERDSGRAAGLEPRIKAHARALGFDLVGITPADPSAHMDFYEAWVAEGRHGEMAYLAREDSLDRRADLARTMASVRSLVVVGQEYFGEDPEGVPEDPSRGVVARYARGSDYHNVMKKKLVALHRWIEGEVGHRVEARPYVDTGPILERELGRRAGLGWFGKNTMLIHPRKGSYFFLGVLLVDLELAPDAPFEEDRCGTCSNCLDACPTGALLGRTEEGAPVMEATRCISYLTIEQKGPIPRELRPLIGNRIYGCDICQESCPWNASFAELASEEAYLAREGLNGPALIEWMGMTEEEFRERFRKSPIKRAKRRGLLRNVAVALGNWGSEEAVPALVAALEDEEPLVRGHAAWALGRIGGNEARAALAGRLEREGDAGVREEVAAASDRRAEGQSITASAGTFRLPRLRTP